MANQPGQNNPNQPGTNQLSRVSKSRTVPDGSSPARVARQHLSSQGKVQKGSAFGGSLHPGAPKPPIGGFFSPCALCLAS